jgi:16S rRNA (guanine527-N7)-methyltransferase
MDSIAALRIVEARNSKEEEWQSLLDIGSGAGFPGAIFAQLFKERVVYLCEPRKKRAVFLKELRRVLGLDNLCVMEQRAETLALTVDMTITRALGDDALFLEVSNKLLSSQGRAVQMVGPSWQEPRSTLAKVEEVVFYRLFPDGPRRGLVFWKCFT